MGTVADSVEVDVNPLLNAVDTTNGYVLDRAQIEAIPLPTGSFTGVAILSRLGVNAELPGGTGVNSGLGNAPIWANGERDTSNSFLLNGVDGSNLFNGKSTSQVASGRVGPSTGVGNDRRRRRDSIQCLGLSLHRQCAAVAGPGNHPGSARERVDVRRPAGRHQRRAHRPQHHLRHQQLSRKSLPASRHQLAQRRALLLSIRTRLCRER